MARRSPSKSKTAAPQPSRVALPPEVMSVEQFAEPAYLDYAMYAVKDRAIPSIEDGMKPVQRRILWAMYSLKLLPSNAKPIKCARIVGDCFAKGTLVSTREGLKPIEKVREGDWINSPSGLVQVVGAFVKKATPLKRLNLENGTHIDVTREQLFRVFDENSWGFSWKTSSAISAGERILSQDFSQRKSAFVSGDVSSRDQAQAYSVGLFLAEGWKTDKNRSTRVGIAMTDVEPIDRIDEICAEVGLKTSRRSYRPAPSDLCQSVSYFKEQHELRVSGWSEVHASLTGTSSLKEIPENILARRDLYPALLAGLIDGDGHVRKDPKRREFVYVTVSEKLADQIVSVLLELGIFSYKTEVSGEEVNRRLADGSFHQPYAVYVSGVNAKSLAGLISPFLTVPKKSSEALRLVSVDVPNLHMDGSERRWPVQSIFDEMSNAHLGAGWFRGADGVKFRSGIRYPSGSKIRYSKDLRTHLFSRDQLNSFGVLSKLDRIGSSLGDRVRDITDNYSNLVVRSVEELPAQETYDIQVDDVDHAFYAAGCVVHNCIGKYHPHGDQSVYDAMVRMSQPFSWRYPLVHGEGNFGSRDGDSPAAMRYTEARLSPLAAALLDELEWDTVDMRPNYDQTMTEPTTLPSKLPFGLLNGASGIAVGMATEIPSHNLGEVAAAARLILTSKSQPTLAEIMEILPAPDFAVGAQIIASPADIAKVYQDGRGLIRVRSTWNFEERGKDWTLQVTSLPPGMSTAKLMIRIDELVNPIQPEKDGKKQPYSPETLRLKKLFGDLIIDVRDGSDKAHPICVVVEPRSRSVDREVLVRALCAYTDMECNVPVNMVFVDLDGVPHQCGLVQWLSQWCLYRIATVHRRTEDEKAKIDHRLHILEGRLTVLDRLDEVIAIIRNSETPRDDLMSKIGLTEIQAEDVLEMRLRSIARLESMKLQEEHKIKSKEQARLAALLASEKAMKKQVVLEIDQITKQFVDERRTLLIPEASSVRAMDDDLMSESLAPEPVGVVLTERGWLAWKPVKSLEEALTADYKIKAGDSVKQVMFADRANHLLVISQTGRAYSLRLVELPSKADTAPLTQFLKPAASEQFVTAVIVQPKDRFLVTTTAGYGFIVLGTDVLNRMSAGKAFLSLDETASPRPFIPVPPLGEPLVGEVLAMSSDGRGVAYPLEEIKVLPKGKGVALLGLAPGATLADLVVVPGDAPVSLLLPNGKTPVIAADVREAIRGHRSAGRKGNRLHKSSEGSSFVRGEKA